MDSFIPLDVILLSELQADASMRKRAMNVNLTARHVEYNSSIPTSIRRAKRTLTSVQNNRIQTVEDEALSCSRPEII